MNIASLVLERARSEPDAIAIRTPIGGGGSGATRYAASTNADLDRESDALAHGLATIGVTLGVRTALMVRPSVDLFAIMLALFKLGAIPVVVDPGIGLRRIRRCLDEAEPEAFIGIPLAQAARRALRWARPTLRIAITAGGPRFLPGTKLADLRAQGRSAGAFPVVPREPEDEAAILFTSGSTGPPKGVIYRHGNFAAQVEAIRGLGRIAKGEVDLPTFPPFALFDPALGMTAVIPDMDPTRPGEVDPLRIIDPAERFGATNLFGSPALLDRVGRYGESHGTRLTTLKRVVSAGAPVSAAIMRRFLAMLPEDAEVLTPYGATECLPVACISSREVLAETAARTDRGAGICVGRPVPSIDARIIAIDDDPIPLWRPQLERPRGEIGEIVVRGPQATAAYYGRPEANALAKISDPDGGFWHRMGDVGYLDSQGRLWYCGRKADRVETGDATLHSIPCEAIFDTHPEVLRTALVGIPARDHARPVLCIELLPGIPRRARTRIEAELRDLASRHAHTRSIDHFLFHRAFPVDIRHNAKIGRPELARWAAQKLRGRGLGPSGGRA